MIKQFLHIQYDNQATTGTCQVSYDITSSGQSDWCHHIFGVTIFSVAPIFFYTVSLDSFILNLAHKTRFLQTCMMVTRNKDIIVLLYYTNKDTNLFYHAV